jgi:hypothetical protein
MNKPPGPSAILFVLIAAVTLLGRPQDAQAHIR